MKKSRFTEEQIIGFLKQTEAGMPIKELCRNGGFSDATFYKWRADSGSDHSPEDGDVLVQSKHPQLLRHATRMRLINSIPPNHVYMVVSSTRSNIVSARSSHP